MQSLIRESTLPGVVDLVGILVLVLVGKFVVAVRLAPVRHKIY